MTRDNIASYEVGRRFPSSAMINLICREYQINEKWLVEGIGPMKNEIPDILMEQIRQTYNLSDLEYRILDKYFSLPDSQRDQVRDFVQELFEQEMPVAEIATRMIAYYGRLASAGSGQIVFDDLPSDFIEIENSQEYRKVIYAIGVNGSSMEPVLSDGDILLIEQANDVEIGDIGIFLIDGEAYVKRRGADQLISINPAYPNVALNETACCMGRVAGKVK